jgi:hypothetical protein
MCIILTTWDARANDSPQAIPRAVASGGSILDNKVSERQLRRVLFPVRTKAAWFRGRNMKTRYLIVMACFGSLWWPALASTADSCSEDNKLDDREKQEGWLLLFDGQSLDGWKTSSETESRKTVEDGCINPHGSGGYMLIHEKTWENFKLALDFKISKGCNSGVFVRTWPLQPRPGKDVGFNGIEIAIDDTSKADFYDTGAIYDLVKPAENVMKPAGEWNHMEITCDGPVIAVELNGKQVSRLNLDEWTEPNQRPDGTAHKFDVAYKSHPRKGYIGLQDHGSNCWYKNIKLLPLK